MHDEAEQGELNLEIWDNSQARKLNIKIVIVITISMRATINQ